MRAAVLDHAPTCILAPYLQITQRICHSILLKSNADAICRAVDALHAGKKDISNPELDRRQPCDTGAHGIEQAGSIAQAQQKCGVEVQMDGARKLAVIVDLQTNEDAASDARTNELCTHRESAQQTLQVAVVCLPIRARSSSISFETFVCQYCYRSMRTAFRRLVLAAQQRGGRRRRRRRATGPLSATTVGA